MSRHRRTQTRGTVVRHSRGNNSVAFLEPLALEWQQTRSPYTVGPIPGFPDGVTREDGVSITKPPGTPSEPTQPFVGEGMSNRDSMIYEQLIEYSQKDGEDEVPRSTCRQKLYHTLNGKVDSPIEYFVLLLILCNVIMFMTGTVWVDRQTGEISCVTLESDDESKCIQLVDKYSAFFDTFEIFSMGVFTIEYFVRLYVCIEDPAYAQLHWLIARLRWMVSFNAIVDLAAVTPTWVELFVPAFNFPGFGILKICRLGRLIKAQDYIDAYSVLRDVATANSALLVVSCWYGFLALVFFSSVLYYTEKNWDGDSGVVFASIPKGMFATALFLTGEFTLDELSPAGEFFALIACLGTVGMMTIPVTVLAAGFIEKIQNERLRKQYIMYRRSSAYMPPSQGRASYARGISFEAPQTDGAETPKTDDIDAEFYRLNHLTTKLVLVETKVDRLLEMEGKLDKLLNAIYKAVPVE